MKKTVQKFGLQITSHGGTQLVQRTPKTHTELLELKKFSQVNSACLRKENSVNEAWKHPLGERKVWAQHNIALRHTISRNGVQNTYCQYSNWRKFSLVNVAWSRAAIRANKASMDRLEGKKFGLKITSHTAHFQYKTLPKHILQLIQTKKCLQVKSAWSKAANRLLEASVRRLTDSICRNNQSILLRLCKGTMTQRVSDGVNEVGPGHNRRSRWTATNADDRRRRQLRSVVTDGHKWVLSSEGVRLSWPFSLGWDFEFSLELSVLGGVLSSHLSFEFLVEFWVLGGVLSSRWDFKFLRCGTFIPRWREGRHAKCDASWMASSKILSAQPKSFVIRGWMWCQMCWQINGVFDFASADSTLVSLTSTFKILKQEVFWVQMHRGGKKLKRN